MNIFISGSMAYDRIMDFPGKFSDYILPDKIHILNVCFNVNGIEENFGGTAGNIAYSLGLLRESPVIMATIGKDYTAYFSWLKSNGISVDGIRIIESEFTAGAYITTDKSDNQITGFNPGAMKHQAEHSLAGANPENSLVLIAPGNLQDMISYGRICREKGIPYICDPGQSLSLWSGELLREWIQDSAVFISNDYELELVMKITGLDKQGIMGLTKTVITTLGDKGSLISTRNANISVPCANISDIVDPTGAGDAYRAGLLKGLAMGRDIESAAKIGAVAAVYAVEKYGTQEHRYSFEEFVSRYKQNFGELAGL